MSTRSVGPSGPTADDPLGRWLEEFVRAPNFLARYPYYAAVLARLQTVADPSVKFMAVAWHDGRFYLHVNVETFLDKPQYLTGILLHEVHHVALGHLTHPKFRDVAAPQLMELAVEMSANEYIEEPLPDPIVWQSFERFGIRAGQSTMERYGKLVAAQQGGKDVRAGASGPLDDHRPWQTTTPHPGAVEQTRRLIEDAVQSVQQSEPGAGDPPEAWRTAHLLAGRDPGDLIEALAGVQRPPRHYLDWKQALQMFVTRVRAPVHTYARPSRRFPDRVGIMPGRTYAPRTVQRPSLLVAIDTSMSMSGEELAEIARQLGVMAVHARLTVVECDTEVTRIYPFAGALDEVAGRGGTDLRPVFGRAVLGSMRPDGVVYFTDGEGPFPAVAPPVPVLWILTKPLAFDCPWGDRAHIGRAPERATPGSVQGGSQSRGGSKRAKSK